MTIDNSWYLDKAEKLQKVSKEIKNEFAGQMWLDGIIKAYQQRIREDSLRREEREWYAIREALRRTQQQALNQFVNNQMNVSWLNKPENQFPYYHRNCNPSPPDISADHRNLSNFYFWNKFYNIKP